MVSFDVESLFTNVPIDAAVQAAPQKIENDPCLADRTTLMSAQIADPLNFVLRSTYFQYKRHLRESGFHCFQPCKEILNISYTKI